MKFILYPYQHEYREGAALSITSVFINLKNPYIEEYLPENTYVYGFLYPLINVPLNKIFGLNIINFRIMSYVFVLISCGFLLLFLLKININLLSSLIGFLSLHFLLINGLATMARPEGLGFFLFMLSTFIPYFFQFSNKSLFFSIIFSLLGFYTKPYYICGTFIIFLYLLIFVNKEKSFFYSIIFLTTFLISIILINLIFPYYLNNSFFHHINVSNYYIDRMMDQLIFFFTKKYIKILCISIFIFIICNFFENKIDLKSIKLSLFKLKTPLIIIKYDLFFLFVSFIVLFLFIFKLGGHSGSNKAYYLYHLISPFIIVLFCQSINWFFSHKDILGKVVFFLIYCYFLYAYKPMYYDDLDKYYWKWSSISNFLSDYERIYNSPEITSILLESNKKITDNGQSQYFKTGLNSISYKFGFSRKVSEIHDNYIKRLNNEVKIKNYDLIINANFINSEILDENYFLYKVFDAPMYCNDWKLKVYLPLHK